MSRAKSPGRTIYLSLEEIELLKCTLSDFEGLLLNNYNSEEAAAEDKKLAKKLLDKLSI